MVETIQISARNLGELALLDFCPRCFWIKLKLRNKLPFQIFPGIFSSIDSYNKKVVHLWFDRFHRPPPWLRPLGDLIDYKEPPHHSNFNMHDVTTNIILTGSPDGILVHRDSSFFIVDYKTAKFTGTQDELYPMYEVQLNAYAFLGNKLGFSPIGGLAFIYMEPQTDDSAAAEDCNQRESGFAMGFIAKIISVPIRKVLIPEMLARTREIYDLSTVPSSRPGCRNCSQVEALVNLVSS